MTSLMQFLFCELLLQTQNSSVETFLLQLYPPFRKDLWDRIGIFSKLKIVFDTPSKRCAMQHFAIVHESDFVKVK